MIVLFVATVSFAIGSIAVQIHTSGEAVFSVLPPWVSPGGTSTAATMATTAASAA